ncbi:hypothetical protein CC86DRAFT_460919 [Ophiobolus disseminans]|uniref:Asl1-like glycosyl hydrolase catalytic domain-containing protein n=1 Tax=Ophiobolus disseminans TaxID=1469910 RepID=A0A6A6ZD49_9PLEO|nr:hypothetical protein CC86DRAFT_460919 [Ophiobolus disseminans]
MHLFTVHNALGIVSLAAAGQGVDPRWLPEDPIFPKARRGVAFNKPDYIKLFAAEGGHVKWSYNWDSAPIDTNTYFEYVPMLRSNDPSHTGPWLDRVKRSADFIKENPTHLLGFNDPDICANGASGSCMSVDDAVTTWKKFMQPAKEYKPPMYFGSPAVTNSGGANEGLNWLKKFMNQCNDCKVDFICVHWYGEAKNVNDFKKHIEETRKIAVGRPIWVTEFHANGTDDEVKAFLDQVLPWMDASRDVQRYAYFMATPGILVSPDGKNTSDIGNHYNMLKTSLHKTPTQTNSSSTGSAANHPSKPVSATLKPREETDAVEARQIPPPEDCWQCIGGPEHCWPVKCPATDDGDVEDGGAGTYGAAACRCKKCYGARCRLIPCKCRPPVSGTGNGAVEARQISELDSREVENDWKPASIDKCFKCGPLYRPCYYEPCTIKPLIDSEDLVIDDGSAEVVSPPVCLSCMEPYQPCHFVPCPEVGDGTDLFKVMTPVDVASTQKWCYFCPRGFCYKYPCADDVKAEKRDEVKPEVDSTAATFGGEIDYSTAVSLNPRWTYDGCQCCWTLRCGLCVWCRPAKYDADGKLNKVIDATPGLSSKREVEDKADASALSASTNDDLNELEKPDILALGPDAVQDAQAKKKCVCCSRLKCRPCICRDKGGRPVIPKPPRPTSSSVPKPEVSATPVVSVIPSPTPSEVKLLDKRHGCKCCKPTCHSCPCYEKGARPYSVPAEKRAGDVNLALPALVLVPEAQKDEPAAALAAEPAKDDVKKPNEPMPDILFLGPDHAKDLARKKSCKCCDNKLRCYTCKCNKAGARPKN